MSLLIALSLVGKSPFLWMSLWVPPPDVNPLSSSQFEVRLRRKLGMAFEAASLSKHVRSPGKTKESVRHQKSWEFFFFLMKGTMYGSFAIEEM